MITLLFLFLGKMWYRSAKQRLWRGKAIKNGWKCFLKLTEDSQLPGIHVLSRLPWVRCCHIGTKNECSSCGRTVRLHVLLEQPGKVLVRRSTIHRCWMSPA